MASQFTGVSIVQSFVQAKIKENIKLRVTGLCEENPPVTGGFPHKQPVTGKMFPFDDVIMKFSQFHRSLFPRVLSTITNHRLRWKFDTEQAISHYLDQWWPSLLMHKCVTRSSISITIQTIASKIHVKLTGNFAYASVFEIENHYGRPYGTEFIRVGIPGPYSRNNDR